MESLSAEEKLCSLFQPDTLLPAQFYDTIQRKRRLMPEYRLMFAVLEDAISCFQKYLAARDEREKKLFREAEEWILGEDSEWVFSFENTCEVLGFDPRYIRRGLLRWKERKMVRSRAKVLPSGPGGIADEFRGRHRSYRLVG